MLSDQLPACLCGSRKYNGGGGSFGSELSYTCFRCAECDRNVFVIEDQIPLLLMDTNASEKSPIMMDYINNTLMTAIRASREAHEDRVMPPQLPAKVTACYLAKKAIQWQKIDHEESLKFPVPKDPIRVRHDQYWDELLTKMCFKKDVHEIPNRYYNDTLNLEPWFEVQVDGRTIRFGPRKRVIAIQVTSEKTFLCEGIAKAAKRDNVTFEADGHWQPWDTKEAKSIEVHAWDEEKFISYFGWIMWDLGRDYGTRKEVADG